MQALDARAAPLDLVGAGRARAQHRHPRRLEQQPGADRRGVGHPLEHLDVVAGTGEQQRGGRAPPIPHPTIAMRIGAAEGPANVNCGWVGGGFGPPWRGCAELRATIPIERRTPGALRAGATAARTLLQCRQLKFDPPQWPRWTSPTPSASTQQHVVADLPGGHVLFSSRRGGVSSGLFASLNLGRLTADDGAAVDPNRELLAERSAFRASASLFGRQVHGTTCTARRWSRVRRRPRGRRPGHRRRHVAALVFTADCLPIALVTDGAVASLHGGWRGLAGGIVAAGMPPCASPARPARSRPRWAPAPRGCCYEVGEEVHAALHRPRRPPR